MEGCVCVYVCAEVGRVKVRGSLIQDLPIWVIAEADLCVSVSYSVIQLRALAHGEAIS